MKGPFTKGKAWLRLVLVAVGLILAASWGVSQALSHGWGRHFLLARLSASFGRPVEVGHFAFSLLKGPSLEADAVTVAEDPQFGNEYFLRADQLTATLHWSALFRGRVEFGTLSITHPSLNLVRAPDGRWNIESWLPPAASAAPPASTDAPQSSPSEKRLSHIVVNDGRINFKRGAEKLLFAFTDVSGHMDQDGSGRWDLDVQADPMRASVSLQESGTIYLRGTVAGTSARLRPAALSLAWEDASLADALRLAGGQDYGVRGVLGAEVAAQIEDPPGAVQTAAAAPSQWRIAGKLHLAGIHRWDLPARPNDPGLNLTFAAALRPASAGATVEHLLLETAHSQVFATADATWSQGFKPDVRVLNSRISLDDLLEWTRAFRPTLPEGFSADGALDVQAEFLAWPPRLASTDVTAAGVVLHFPGLAGPIRLGPVSASLRDRSLVLQPLSLNLPGGATLSRGRASSVAAAPPASAGTLRVDGSLGPLLSAKSPATSPADWPYRLTLSGRTTRAQDLMIAANVFSLLLGPDSKLDSKLDSKSPDAQPTWKVEGPASLQLAWQGTPRHLGVPPTGTLNLSGLEISSPMLNQPLLVSSANVDLRPGERHVKLAALQALGASWKGTLDWDAADRVWRFDLAADHLDAAELDRWLGPRARPGFFARMFPFTGDDALAARDAAIERLTARGQLHVAELSLAPLDLQRIEASVELKGRRLALRNAQAAVSDGRVFGDFAAQLTSDPSYSFHGQFDRVNLAPLTSSENEPDGRLSGLASGNIELAAHGIGSASLLASLSAQADFRVRDPILRGIDHVSGSLAAGDSRIPGETRFRTADASFHLAAGVVHVDRLSLAGRDASLEAQGSVDLARGLDLRVWSMPLAADALAADSDSPAERAAERVLAQRTAERSSERNLDREEWSIGGTFDAPLVTHQSPMAADPSVAPAPDASAPSVSSPFQRR